MGQKKSIQSLLILVSSVVLLAGCGGSGSGSSSSSSSSGNGSNGSSSGHDRTYGEKNLLVTMLLLVWRFTTNQQMRHR